MSNVAALREACGDTGPSAVALGRLLGQMETLAGELSGNPLKGVDDPFAQAAIEQLGLRLTALDSPG